MNLTPLHDRIVVKPAEAETKTASGLIIPDSAADKPTQGTVLAVGPGRRTADGSVIPMSVTAGDTVLFGKFAGQTVKVNNQELTILKEEDVFAVVLNKQGK
jgi:chaperonin GroES